MMEAIRQYIFSVCACAVLCGIVMNISGKGISRELMKLLCGLILGFTVIRPLMDFNFSALSDFQIPFSEDAAQASAMGEEMAQEVLQDIIKTKTEAYILDKAASLNISIEAEVEVGDEDLPVPKRIRIVGSVSPYARQQLERFLVGELGVSKEDVRWIG